MKKKVLAYFSLLAMLLSVMVFPMTVSAENRQYWINGYNIQAVILPDGSVDITERIQYNFSGSFNGVVRDVDYSETDGIDYIQVFAESWDGSQKEFSLNSSDLDAEGPTGTYNLQHDNELARFKVYERTEDAAKTFIYKYTLKNVVTKYNDIAEFNRKIIDSNWDVDLNNITINIVLPEGASVDEIKVFGHGPLTGESRIIDGQNVEFILGNLSPGNNVGTRVLFPPRLVPDSANVKAEDGLSKIMDEEAKLANEANEQREEARQKIARENELKDSLSFIGNIIGVILIILWLPLIIFIYFKYDKELRSSFNAKYYRELPGEYTPAEMSVLVSMGQVGTKDITATLMDLVRKGQLILNKETYIKDGFFRDKEVEDYSLTINSSAPPAALKRHEEMLINWFVRIIGNGSRVFLDEITAYAKTQSGARQFTKDYERWCNEVKNEAEKNNFFDKSSKKGQLTAILTGLLGYLLLGIVLIGLLHAEAGVAMVVLGIVMFLFGIRLTKRTAFGNEQNAMWKAFKNFLKDFSQMDKAEMPSIVIWEHYLVYAISLGVAKEVIKQLPIVFSDVDFQNSNLTYMNSFSMHNLHDLSNAFDRTVSSVDHAVSNAVAVANSTNSSSSGSGGGFSGGSSGGGGGGGGGAF